MKFKVGDKVKIPTRKTTCVSLESCTLYNDRNGHEFAYISRIGNGEITLGWKLDHFCSSFHINDIELYEDPPILDKLPKYWFVKGKHQEVNDFLAHEYGEPDIRGWHYECVGYDGSDYYKGCHGFPEGCEKNNATKLTIEEFRRLTNTNKEPQYEIY